MTTAIGLVRVSTAQQVDGESLGSQRERIEAWCAYNKVTLIGIEEDAGISGTNMARPGLTRALRTAIELGSEGVFVVSKLDRLGRDALGIQEALALLTEAGVRVVAISDGVDSGSGMGSSLLKLLTGVLASFADLERETIRSRLLDGRRRADRENRRYASEPRYGRKVSQDGRTLQESAEEMAAQARARTLRAQGLSFRQIGLTLVQEGHRPRRASSWAPSVLRRLVTGAREPKAKKAGRRYRLDQFLERYAGTDSANLPAL